MKIIFLAALIPVVLICIESKVGAQGIWVNRDTPANPDHCHGPYKQECLAGPFIYEYFTPQYSEEREYPVESYLWPLRRTFCPRRYSWPCRQKVNECCSDSDCDPIQICCFENCGNTCQFPVSFPVDGVRVQHHDSNCQVDPMFLQIPMPSI